MSYKEIPNHRLLPSAVIEQYCNGLGRQVNKDSYPLELIADYEYYTEKPHMLSEFVVRKWYEQGLLDSYAEHANLELVK